MLNMLSSLNKDIIIIIIIDLSTYCSPRSDTEKLESEIFHTRNGFRNCQFVSLSHSEEFLYVCENDK